MLAYCVAEQQTQFSSLGTGVEGAPVRWVDVGALRCFVSDFAAQMPYAPVPEMVKAFNRVLQRIFAQAVIIPFRFPTIVESEDTLRQFVESRAAEYSGALKRLRNKVQMDVRIISKAHESANSSATQSRRGRSGRGYLEERRERYQQAQSVMDEFRRVSNPLAEEWIQRDTSAGIRSFALVDRSSLAVSWKESAALLPLPISRLASPGHGLPVNSQKSRVSKKRTKRDSSAAGGREETTSVPARIELSPANIEQGLAKLVLTLIDFLRQLLERQAIRRMEGGALSDQEIEEMGEALMKLEAKIQELAEQFGLSPADLNIDLGPLSRLR